LATLFGSTKPFNRRQLAITGKHEASEVATNDLCNDPPVSQHVANPERRVHTALVKVVRKKISQCFVNNP